jgi:hypothetical protein
MHLGSFSSALSAALAYDRAVYALRGRNAKTNFPVTEELLAASRTRSARDAERTADCLSNVWTRGRAIACQIYAEADRQGITHIHIHILSLSLSLPPPPHTHTLSLSLSLPLSL